ncbi:MAG: hypothetical protein GXP62_13920 [Oligoflexia bacterium]|nr:hypothetical protein [Oligoflexia bacterium]
MVISDEEEYYHAYWDADVDAGVNLGLNGVHTLGVGVGLADGVWKSHYRGDMGKGIPTGQGLTVGLTVLDVSQSWLKQVVVSAGGYTELIYRTDY